MQDSLVKGGAKDSFGETEVYKMNKNERNRCPRLMRHT